MGAVVIDPEGHVRQEISQGLGITTNNIAEYTGLIAGLEAALALGARRVEVRMDSELIMRQAIGRYRVRHPGLIPLYSKLQELRSKFDHVAFAHVPRLNKPRYVTVRWIWVILPHYALILAAGETPDGPPQAALPWGGVPLVAWQVERSTGGLDEIVSSWVMPLRSFDQQSRPKPASR
jgi:hypothetical protein